MPYIRRTNNPKMGRPTTDPKGNRLNIRLSDGELARLEYCAERLGCGKSAAIQTGLRILAESLERQETDQRQK